VASIFFRGYSNSPEMLGPLSSKTHLSFQVFQSSSLMLFSLPIFFFIAKLSKFIPIAPFKFILLVDLANFKNLTILRS